MSGYILPETNNILFAIYRQMSDDHRLHMIGVLNEMGNLEPIAKELADVAGPELAEAEAEMVRDLFSLLSEEQANQVMRSLAADNPVAAETLTKMLNDDVEALARIAKPAAEAPPAAADNRPQVATVKFGNEDFSPI